MILAGVIGLSLSLSAQDATDISDELRAMLEDSRVPALAAAAVVDGEIVSLGAAGVRKVGSPVEVTIDDKFHLGSCTKSMTATLGAMLVQSGDFDWHATLAGVFPNEEIHPDFRGVTFKQLVTNTGGAPGQVEAGLWADLWKSEEDERGQRLQLLRGVISEPPAYRPGAGQVYSNAGFAIAGAMLEQVMDRSFEDLLAARLFQPLSMEHAGFRAPATNGKVDQPYGHVEQGGEVVAVPPEPKGDNPAAIAPAGAVHCSVADFAQYARLHLGVLDDDLLSADSIEQLQTPANGMEYAAGWVATNRDWAGGKALTHIGSNTMFHAVIWLAPEKDAAVVAMCNFGGEEGFEKCDEAIESLIKTHFSSSR